MEILEGSYGGRLRLDGMDAVDTLYANTRNNPIEDIESHLPLRVNRYELRENVVAPGRVARRSRLGARVHLSHRRRLFGRGRGPQDRALGICRRRRRPPGRADLQTGPASAIALPSKVPYQQGGARRPSARLRPERRRLRRPAPRATRRRCSTTCSTASSSRGDRARALRRGVANGTVDVAATEKLRQARN